MACVASAQFPAGFNYNPYLYFPYSALSPPAQETAEVAAARRAHEAAHAAARRGKRSFENETPEVRAATIEFYRAYNAASLANGVNAYLPARYANMPWAMPQPVQETAEVAAARRAHMAAHAIALARGKRSFENETPEVRAATIEFYRAYNAASLANGVNAFLPARYANMPWAMPQPVQETPEVAAARRAHLAAHALAAARG